MHTFFSVAKVLVARGPGATAARREPLWACFTREHLRLRASPGAQGLEKWLGESAAAPPTRRRRPGTPVCLVSRAVSLPRINIGADVWGESSIMTGVY